MALQKFERRERIARERYEKAHAVAADEFVQTGKTKEKTIIQLLDASAIASHRSDETARAKRNIQAGLNPLNNMVAFRFCNEKFIVRPIPEFVDLE